MFIEHKKLTIIWWWLQKLVAGSAMGCVKWGIPETGFVGKEKSVLYLAGGGRASVYLSRVFPLYAPGAGMTEKLAKLRSNPVD